MGNKLKITERVKPHSCRTLKWVEEMMRKKRIMSDLKVTMMFVFIYSYFVPLLNEMR